MILTILIFFIFYTLSIGCIISIGFFRQREKEKAYRSEGDKIDPGGITVLIPFRNEAERIGPLLASIRELEKLPRQFVFIDDHSTDQGAQRIEENLDPGIYTILALPKGIYGKKRALRYAIERCNTEYILTMDADIRFLPDYFNALSGLGKADMYLLPVKMIPATSAHYLFELDLVLVNAANAGLSGLARPIIASGANLLYGRKAFEEADNFDSHAHAASGDDTYLLRDFRKERKDVRLVTDPRLAVTTETPGSFREFIDQRLRWIGKTGDMKDHLSTGLGALQAVLTLSFTVLLIWAAFEGIRYFLIVFGLKAVIDLFLFYPYFRRIERLKTWLFIPLYELVFPLYTSLILILLPVYKPKWKGREIYVRDS